MEKLSKEEMAKRKSEPLAHKKARLMGLEPTKTYECKTVAGFAFRTGNAVRPVVHQPSEIFQAKGFEIAGLGHRVMIRRNKKAWTFMPKLIKDQSAVERTEARSVAARIRQGANRLHRAMESPRACFALSEFPLPEHLEPYIPQRLLKDVEQKE